MNEDKNGYGLIVLAVLVCGFLLWDMTFRGVVAIFTRHFEGNVGVGLIFEHLNLAGSDAVWLGVKMTLGSLLLIGGIIWLVVWRLSD